MVHIIYNTFDLSWYCLSNLYNIKVICDTIFLGYNINISLYIVYNYTIMQLIV